MESPLFKQILKRLKQLRKEQGLTQEQFAENTGISYKYYQAVEAGRKRDLRLSTLERLAKAYGIEAWQLLSPDSTKVRAKKAIKQTKTPHYTKKA